jgi:hypothetical protein
MPAKGLIFTRDRMPEFQTGILPRFTPSDLRPAETHRHPGGDQLQHRLAGVSLVTRHVLGQLDAGAELSRHDPYFKRRRACRKTVSIHRQPMSFGEVEEHCRIAAGGDDPPGRGLRLEPILSEIFLPRHALHPILSNQDQARSAIGIEHRWCGRQLFELAAGLLAAGAIAGRRQNRLPDRLKFHLAALAGRGKRLLRFLVHDGFPFAGSIRGLVWRQSLMSATELQFF